MRVDKEFFVRKVLKGMKGERAASMATQPRKRPGRPARELEPGERVPMSFRVRPELKNRMDAAAAESGRSVAQEIELRLEQSFLIERLIETRLIDVMRE